jgi:hypothetical protein
VQGWEGHQRGISAAKNKNRGAFRCTAGQGIRHNTPRYAPFYPGGPTTKLAMGLAMGHCQAVLLIYSPDNTDKQLGQQLEPQLLSALKKRRDVHIWAIDTGCAGVLLGLLSVPVFLALIGPCRWRIAQTGRGGGRGEQMWCLPGSANSPDSTDRRTMGVKRQHGQHAARTTRVVQSIDTLVAAVRASRRG